MGYRRKDFSEEEAMVSSSVGEALIFATMCIVGLPVDVHVKDGSVFSGIFHTASVENDYDVVLKKARMTRKGKCDTNVADGSVVETLFILSDDLVQVVAKGALLTAGGVSGTIASDDSETLLSSESSDCKNEPKKSTKFTFDGKTRNDASQIGDGMLHVKEGNQEIKFKTAGCRSVDEVCGSNVTADDFISDVKAAEEGPIKMASTESPHVVSTTLGNPANEHVERPTLMDTLQDAVFSAVSTSFSPVSDAALISLSGSSGSPFETAPPQSSVPSKTAKGFKLNPEAKVFSPSLANTALVAPKAPSVPSVAFVPNTTAVVPVTAADPELGIPPLAAHSPVPVKLVAYSNLMAGNSVSEFSQHIVGHLGNRAQPMRHAAQYHPVQAGATGPEYVHSSSQAVMVGRLGQLVYLHPYSQAPAAVSPILSCPLMTQQVQFPKHRGTVAGQPLPLSMPQPFLNCGQQPLAAPTHITVLQPPFPANPAIAVPAFSGPFGTKLP